MQSLKHIHTLERVSHKTRKDLFKCKHPECSFYNNVAYLLGKKVRCPFCGEDYIFNHDAARRKLPRCENCIIPSSGPKKPSLVPTETQVAPKVNIAEAAKKLTEKILENAPLESDTERKKTA